MSKVYRDLRQLNDFTGINTTENKFSVVAQDIASMGKSKPSLEQQLAAAKSEIAELHICLDYADEWLTNTDADYNGSLFCKDVAKALAKHKGIEKLHILQESGS